MVNTTHMSRPAFHCIKDMLAAQAVSNQCSHKRPLSCVARTYALHANTKEECLPVELLLESSCLFTNPVSFSHWGADIVWLIVASCCPTEALDHTNRLLYSSCQ